MSHFVANLQVVPAAMDLNSLVNATAGRCILALCSGINHHA